VASFHRVPGHRVPFARICSRSTAAWARRNLAVPVFLHHWHPILFVSWGLGGRKRTWQSGFNSQGLASCRLLVLREPTVFLIVILVRTDPVFISRSLNPTDGRGILEYRKKLFFKLNCPWTTYLRLQIRPGKFDLPPFLSGTVKVPPTPPPCSHLPPPG
jgi:hypothetical protein